MTFLCRNSFKPSKILNLLSNLSLRPLSQFAYDSDPTNDLNQVILLGSVNSVSVRDDPRPHAVISLLTKNTYKTVTGYGIKYLSHRVHVFEQPLIEKSRQIKKSDRICVCGYLTAFPLTDDPKHWYQCIVAQLISPYSDALEPPSQADLAEPMDDVRSILKPEDLV